MDNLLDKIVYYAAFYDDNGNFHGKKRLDKNQSVFTYCKRSYVFRPNDSSYYKRSNIFWRTRVYHYNLNNPEPLVLKQNYKPFMTGEQFGILIETNALQKLNNLAKKSILEELLTPRNIIIGLVVIAVIWYMSAHGGKLW